MLDFVLDVLGFGLKLVLVLLLVLGPIFLFIVSLVKSKKDESAPKGLGAKANLVFADLKQQERKCQQLMAKQLKKSNPDKKLRRQEKELGLTAKDKEKAKELAAAEAEKAAAPEQSNAANAATPVTAEATASPAVENKASADSKATTTTDSKAATADKASAESKANADSKTSADSKDSAEQDKKKKKKNSKQARRERLLQKIEKREAFVHELQEKRAAGEFCPRNLFVVDFKGSTKGSEFQQLRQKVDAILAVATDEDEVIINLNSPGGLVNTYGLCASQLQRLRDHQIFVTVTVDEVAASGGYLMACVANKIVAAPFAYVGSIGVIAGIPNFRRVLNKFDVDYEQVTAGKFKRTLSVLGENTEEGRAKFKQELEAVHQRFKEQVSRYRPQLNIEEVATGEHWLAADALKLGLVDEIATSDEYIHERIKVTENSALKVAWKKSEKKKNFLKLLLSQMRFAGAHKGALGATAGAVGGAALAASAMGAAESNGADEAVSEGDMLQEAQRQLNALDQSSFMQLR